ncbi:hypothetical protein EOD39_7059 [Acipenser ruthenus]|uniref:Uncharacterized protein n=1 Tax=Acipenser ruthenus TaxID=7906 RepID=A0A444U856_ACIRT|nr:hypothetical protein EOD39_7059 [Acipenser ruthenus]
MTIALARTAPSNHEQQVFRDVRDGRIDISPKRNLPRERDPVATLLSQIRGRDVATIKGSKAGNRACLGLVAGAPGAYGLDAGISNGLLRGTGCCWSKKNREEQKKQPRRAKEKQD